MILYRPCGPDELRLVFESGMRRWPPRLPEQPIFYPVLNQPYAATIARDWNAQSHSQAGYVTRFAVPDSFASQFPRQIVGGREHEELWVPAERLGELNDSLIGTIQLVDAFFGPRFRGFNDLETGEELRRLIAALTISENDLLSAIDSSRSAVFLSYPYWATLSADRYKIELPLELVLRSIREVWKRLSPDTPLHP